MRVGNWLEALRDRVVVRSQIGKRKLDAVRTRRELDQKLFELGERVLTLVHEGKLLLPSDMSELVDEATELEKVLDAQQQEIASLEHERV